MGAEVLAHPITRLTVEPTQCTINFGRVIDQNFARMEVRLMRQLVKSLRPVEWGALAAGYPRSNSMRRDQPRLLDIMAIQLDDASLARVSQVFGFDAVYAAVARWAPDKCAALLQTYSGRGSTPTPDGADWIPFLNYTVHEIYLNFRTTPFGAHTGVVPALYQTAELIWKPLSLAWIAGQAMGTVIRYGIEYFAPNLYTTIGGTINEMVEQHLNSNPLPQADLQRGDGISFELTPYAYNYMEQTGGDFGVVESWSVAYGGCRPAGAPVAR